MVRYDEFMPCFFKMPDYLAANDWKMPTTNTNNPWTFTHNSGGVPFWQFLEQFPKRGANFNRSMEGLSRHTMWTIGLFPWQEEFSQAGTSDDTVVVVDIGGGRGHVAQRIKELMGPDVKGRIVVEDLPEVVKDALPGVEVVGHDFFQPQPIKGTSFPLRSESINY